LLTLLEGCGGCVPDEAPRGYTLTDTQYAQLTEGTGAATDRGCQLVCGLLWNNDRADGGADAGPFYPNDGRNRFTCTASPHEVNCTLRGFCFGG
jgi:hypothetical protein